MKRIILFLIIVMFSGRLVLAAEVNVPPNQAKLEINGAVCAYCAYGMQKVLSKMGCVDASQGHNGVESDIENQIVTIYLKEDEVMNLKEMADSIKKSGYEPRRFHLRATGSAIKEGQQRFLINSSHEKLFELSGAMADRLKTQINYDLQLTISEEAIKALKVDHPPLAEVHTIIKGE